MEKKCGIISKNSLYKSGVSCLLCGKFIETYIPTPTICEDCKSLWKKIKEERSTARSANNE